MSDYTYIRPELTADADAALAAVAQDAPALDLEYTYDGPPVELVRPGELAQLRVRLDAAEAQLAAVPDYAAYHFEAQLYHDLAEGPEPLDFAEWLAQRASSQRSE